MPEEEFYPMLVTNNGNYYEIDEEKNVTYIDDSEVFTITKIYDDDTTETQFVRKGNNYGLISYKKREGELFKGWSNSPDSFNVRPFYAAAVENGITGCRCGNKL